MGIRMLILDLDGTVLHSDKTISDYTKSVFGRCRKNGIKIVAATARAEWSAKKYLEQIKPDFIISNGGALVRDCGYGIAMGNAIDEVKRVAYDVCDTNDNDGVAKWLEGRVC